MTKTARAGSKRSSRSRYGRFFVDPDDSGYENAVGECSECDSRLVVNRSTELDDTYPSSGERFKCFNCGRTLRLGGDIANHRVDQIGYDALRPLRRREYMQAVLMVAQGLEFALALCLYEIVLGDVPQPKRLRPTSLFSRLRIQLAEQMERLTLGQLRAVVAGLGAAGISPRTITEARETIETLRTWIGHEPKASVVAEIADPRLRSAVTSLVAAKSFVRLRNDIAHYGMRPDQSTAEYCFANVPKLATLCLRAFGVMQGQLVMPPKAGGRRRARR